MNCISCLVFIASVWSARTKVNVSEHLLVVHRAVMMEDALVGSREDGSETMERRLAIA